MQDVAPADCCSPLCFANSQVDSGGHARGGEMGSDTRCDVTLIHNSEQGLVGIKRQFAVCHL